jgi:hypothetical protein
VRRVLLTGEAARAQLTTHLLDSLFAPAFRPMELHEEAVDAFRPFPGAREDIPLSPLDVHFHEIGVTAEEIDQCVERLCLDSPVTGWIETKGPLFVARVSPHPGFLRHCRMQDARAPTVHAGDLAVPGVEIDTDDERVPPERLVVRDRQTDVAPEVEHRRWGDGNRRDVELAHEHFVKNLLVRRARAQRHRAPQLRGMAADHNAALTRGARSRHSATKARSSAYQRSRFARATSPRLASYSAGA